MEYITGKEPNISEGLSLPNPRVSRKFKLTSKKWQQDTLNYFINNKDREQNKRKTKSEIESNWNFYNTYLTENEVKLHLDPNNVLDDVSDEEFSSFQFYNLLDNPFSTLIGEELKRRFDVKAYALNPEIQNSKDKEFTDKVLKYFNKLAQKESVNEEEVKKKLQEFDVFKVKDLQSAHEKMANELLKYLKEDTKINSKFKFNSNFLNYQITNEEIYRIYNKGKQIDFIPVNSKNFYVIGLNSNFIEEADAWIEEEYLSPYKIIDEFAEELSDSEIKKLLEWGNISDVGGTINPKQMFLTEQGIWDKDNIPNESVYVKNSELAKKQSLLAFDYGDEDFINENGEIRIYRVQFKTIRKIGILTYIDNEIGIERSKFVDEEYPVDEDKGESIEYIYINDIFEGCKIGNDLYKKVGPLAVQMRSLLNPSLVRPSYVGYVNFNMGGKGQCRIDKLKPYQRLYNVWMNKLVTLWMDNIGKVASVDTAKIPSDMDTDEWFLWLKRFHIMFENSFEEGKKGMAKGQLAGNMQQNSKVIDLSLAQDINQAVNMLIYIEKKVNEISAIPEARQGNMSGNEGLGVSQQAVINSSSRTEHDFFTHDMLKARTYEIMLEYCKWLWKDEKLKLQYITSDMSSYLINIDGELLSEAELGVQITNSSESYEMSMLAKQLLHPAMQNGSIGLSDALYLQLQGTPNEIIERIRQAEDRKAEEQRKLEEKKAEMQKQALQLQDQIKDKDLLREKDKLQFEHELKLIEIEADNKKRVEQHSRDTNQNHIDDEVEIMKIEEENKGKEKLQREKLAAEKEMKEKELESKEKIEQLKLKAKNKSK